MDRKILLGSIGAAVLLILVSFNSVVGSNAERLSAESNHVSPLFTLRANRRINKDYSHNMNPAYIGKGRLLNIFPDQKLSLRAWADKAVKLIDNRPAMVYAVLDKAEKIPAVINMLNEQGINVNDFVNYINRIKNNPEMLKQEIEKAVQAQNEELPITDPEPQSLNTQGGLIGCFIGLLILLPIILLIGVLIATITIITCLFPTCLENLMQGLLEGLSQGLTPP